MYTDDFIHQCHFSNFIPVLIFQFPPCQKVEEKMEWMDLSTVKHGESSDGG